MELLLLLRSVGERKAALNSIRGVTETHVDDDDDDDSFCLSSSSSSSSSSPLSHVANKLDYSALVAAAVIIEEYTKSLMIGWRDRHLKHKCRNKSNPHPVPILNTSSLNSLISEQVRGADMSVDQDILLASLHNIIQVLAGSSVNMNVDKLLIDALECAHQKQYNYRGGGSNSLVDRFKACLSNHHKGTVRIKTQEVDEEETVAVYAVPTYQRKYLNLKRIVGQTRLVQRIKSKDSRSGYIKNSHKKELDNTSFISKSSLHTTTKKRGRPLGYRKIKQEINNTSRSVIDYVEDEFGEQMFV
jgi:hypothetical protein